MLPLAGSLTSDSTHNHYCVEDIAERFIFAPVIIHFCRDTLSIFAIHYVLYVIHFCLDSTVCHLVDLLCILRDRFTFCVPNHRKAVTSHRFCTRLMFPLHQGDSRNNVRTCNVIYNICSIFRRLSVAFRILAVLRFSLPQQQTE